MLNQTVYPFGQNGQLPAGYPIADDLKTDSAQQALSAKQGKIIGEILYDEKKTFSDDLTVIYDGKLLKADSTSIGKTLAQVTKTNYAAQKNFRIPVKGAETVSFIGQSSGSDNGCLFLNENDVVISGYVATQNGRQSTAVPEGASWFIWSYEAGIWSSTSRYITVTYIVDKEQNTRLDKAEEAIDELENVAAKEKSVSITGLVPEMRSGKIDSNGEPVANSAYLTTETIFGDFSLVLAEGWRVYEGHLYDRSGRMVSYQHIHPDVSHTGARGVWSARKFMATANAVPGYGMRLTLCKSDQSAITDGEQPVENFVLLSDSALHRWVPNDLPNYAVALRRIDYIQNLRWVPLAKVPDGYPASGQTTNLANTHFFHAGRLAIGVPYSDVAETRTYVPNNVSLRTYMTAIANKRSLIYTEELATNTSKYGKTYKTGNRRAYYGAVCDSFVAWVMGMDTLFITGQYGADNVPGLSPVTYNSVDDLRPLDLIWNDGHISVISDIYKDEFGVVKYIVWAEMSTPYIYRTPYTPEQFNERMIAKSAAIKRWDGWENLQEPESSEYSQYLLGQTMKMPEWSGDIMCFAGDYAAFVEGDTIYLNARRNSTYTGVELYKDDVLLQTIDITGLSADTIVTPNNEDWVAVNLTSLNLTYGKYKARLTDGTNTTDYTYFEIVDVTFSATYVSSSSISVTVGSNSGVPVAIGKVKENGFPSSPSGQFHAITAEEVSAGTFTLGWSYNSTYKYLVLLVRADYGTVHKMISFPT